MTAAENTNLLVVGAGPAGLAAARAVAAAGHHVIVIDREDEAGGVPRHCAHTGFGLRDLHRTYSGPTYAKEIVRRTLADGVEIRTGTTATDWAGSTSMHTTSRIGRSLINADAVLLATGCRERPPSARLIPGSRPAGIYTTGALQQLVHLAGHPVGRRAVVVGAEHIAFSAVHTLLGSGTEVAAVITPSPILQTFQLLRAGTAGIHAIPVLYGCDITAIEGSKRVTGLSITSATGISTRLACDTTVFTGDWIPDYELARSANLAMDAATKGPITDTAGSTSRPGVYAAGNVCHPAEPADIAALTGAHIGHSITAWLDGSSSSAREWQQSTLLQVSSPLLWISPQRLVPSRLPACDRFVLRAEKQAGAGTITVTQQGHTLYRHRVRRLTPNRSLTLPADWTTAVDSGGTVVIGFQPR